MTVRILLAVTLLFLAGASSAHAAEAEQSRIVNWTSFRGGLLLANQGGGSSLSFMLRYSPEFFIAGESLNYRLSVGPTVGIGALHNSGAPPFALIEYGAFISYQFIDTLSARMLGGAQTWTSDNSTAAFAGAELHFHFNFSKDSSLAFLDRAFVAYSSVFKPLVAHEFIAGLGVQL